MHKLKPFLLLALLVTLSASGATDSQPAGAGPVTNAQRVITVQTRYLNLPVKNGAPKRRLRLLVNGKLEREFNIELADGQPDWWAFTDVSAFRGQSLVVQADQLPVNSQGLAQIAAADDINPAGPWRRLPWRTAPPRRSRARRWPASSSRRP